MPEPSSTSETYHGLYISTPPLGETEPVLPALTVVSGLGQITSPETSSSGGEGFLVGTERLKIEDVASRFCIQAAELNSYLSPGEQLTGFGNGGSESLVLFVHSPTRGDVVRKVCSEHLSAVHWDPDGTGVMSPPSSKARHQVNYLQALPGPVRPYFPTIFDVRELTIPAPNGDGGEAHKLIYDQSLLKGQEVSSFIAEHTPTPGIVAHLHREILRCLADRVHPHRVVENVDSTIAPSHLDKMIARLELSQRAAPRTFTPLLTSNQLVINGRSYRNIGELLSFFRRPEISELLEPRHHSLVMGDSNTENVMITRPEALLEAMEGPPVGFTYDDLGIKFLDPRAIGYNSVGARTVDDRMYDNKPYHNSVGNYDMIHGEHFRLALDILNGVPYVRIDPTADNPFKRPYQDVKKYFRYVMEGWKVTDEEFLAEDPNWLLRFTFMMGSHFTSMPPFHFKRGPGGNVPEDPEVQKRAIAIYCEGIRWLNSAHDMLTGKRRELHGIPVTPDQFRTREGDKIDERIINEHL